MSTFCVSRFKLILRAHSIECMSQQLGAEYNKIGHAWRNLRLEMVGKIEI